MNKSKYFIVILVTVLCMTTMWLGWAIGTSNQYDANLKQASLDKMKYNNTIANLTAKFGTERRVLNRIIANLKDENRLEKVKTSRGDLDRKQVFTITAYSPYDNQSGIECDGNPNDTATGTKPKPGTIAVDPKVIPYGSAIVVIYDDGTIELGKAEDCGGWVKGNHIDVFRRTYEEASKFGCKKAVVMWYKEEKAK